MRLNDVLNQMINQNHSNIASVGQSGAANAASQIPVQIQALAPGQILQGEVVESTGDAVKLLLQMNGETVSLQARLEQNAALSIGKNLLFQVKNNGSSLSLSPLLENIAMGETAAKALESASLPLNETTVQMTTTLMQEGMAIHKESLQGIYQEVLANTNAELMDIIDLHKLNLPVTSENLEQLHSYKEMTHQLTGGVEQMSADLMQMVKEMSQNGQGKAIAPMLQDIFQFAQGDIQQISNGNTIVFADETVIQQGDATLNQSSALVSEKGSEAATMVKTEHLLEDLAKALQNSESGSLQTNAASVTDVVKQLLEHMRLLENDSSSLARIVENEDFSKGLKMVLQEQMLLDPETAADKEQVREFFNKISRQLNTISDALVTAGQEQSPMAKTVQNMSQNVNFLNQMNQMYAYIQLPFKLSESNAHGELYVYSNKKNLASKEGEVSALLHLDMEHLGPVDVYVQMKETNVSTRFFLKDDEMLDFINEHIHILTERLEKRGYNMSCRMVVRGEEDGQAENVTLKELLNENSNRPALVNYSFDVRA